jgi:hypothetical protein
VTQLGRQALTLAAGLHKPAGGLDAHSLPGLQQNAQDAGQMGMQAPLDLGIISGRG